MGEINFNNYNGSNNDQLVPLAGIRSELFSPVAQLFPSIADDGADLVFYTSESSNASTTSTGILDRMKLGMMES